jgi:amidase
MTDLLALSGTAQARLIRNGELSSAELVDAHLQRIDEVNPKLNAVVELLAAEARQSARRIGEQRSRGAALGPLAGVPFSVKDSIEVEGTVCTAGTLGLQSAAPSLRDATVVARLRAAGAIPIARTNLPDLLFAFETDNLLHGRTNNPYDLARTSGGSSGGEAALIAACGSPFGLGSDAARALLRHREHQADLGAPASHGPRSSRRRLDRNPVADRPDGPPRRGSMLPDAAAGLP